MNMFWKLNSRRQFFYLLHLRICLITIFFMYWHLCVWFFITISTSSFSSLSFIVWRYHRFSLFFDHTDMFSLCLNAINLFSPDFIDLRFLFQSSDESSLCYPSRASQDRLVCLLILMIWTLILLTLKTCFLFVCVPERELFFQSYPYQLTSFIFLWRDATNLLSLRFDTSILYCLFII